jgi:hypothetical protein
MSDLKELKHALDIIQQKLNACHYEQRNIINKVNIVTRKIVFILTRHVIPHADVSEKKFITGIFPSATK